MGRIRDLSSGNRTDWEEFAVTWMVLRSNVLVLDVFPHVMRSGTSGISLSL